MQNLNPIVTAAMANKTGPGNKLGSMKNSPTVRHPGASLLSLSLTRRSYSKEGRSGRLGCSPLRLPSQTLRQERKCRHQTSIPLHLVWVGQMR